MRFFQIRLVALAVACALVTACSGGSGAPSNPAMPFETASPVPSSLPTVAATTSAATATPTLAATATPTLAATASPTPSPAASATPATPTATPTPAATVSAAPQSASSTEALLAAGGTLTVPAFGGFTGNVGYPTNDAPSGTTVTLTSSTSNVASLPMPSSGTVVFYEQVALSSSAANVTFNAGNASGSVTSAALGSANTYTLYVYASEFGASQLEGSTNLGSPVNATLSFASPIGNQTVPVSATLVLEIVRN